MQRARRLGSACRRQARDPGCVLRIRRKAVRLDVMRRHHPTTSSSLPTPRPLQELSNSQVHRLALPPGKASRTRRFAPGPAGTRTDPVPRAGIGLDGQHPPWRRAPPKEPARGRARESPESAASAAGVQVLPRTDASWTNRRSGADSPSSRAAMSAWSVSGTSRSSTGPVGRYTGPFLDEQLPAKQAFAPSPRHRGARLRPASRIFAVSSAGNRAPARSAAAPLPALAGVRGRSMWRCRFVPALVSGPGRRQRHHERLGTRATSSTRYVDEVEQRRVGPLQVLEDHDHRVACGEPFEEQAPARKQI